jgi:hypothetical protein
MPVYQVKYNRICGYLAKGFSGWPGNLQIQFRCPCSGCKERQDLTIQITSWTSFIVNAEEFYDMEYAVNRNDQEIIYDHRENAITKSSFYTHKPYLTMKDLSFAFIHQCTSCTKNFYISIIWSETREGFEFRMWRYKNSGSTTISLTQIWALEENAAERLLQKAGEQEWTWGQELEALEDRI